LGRATVNGMLMASLFCLFGCAAREVTPIAISQPGDEQLSCDALKQQIADNSAAEAVYRRKDKQVESGNTAKTAGAAIPVAGLFIAGSIDLSNEEQVKARALADRIEQLQFLAKQKGCTQ
jgi:hypothetical protein